MNNYLDLVEELPKFPQYTLFEKIIIASQRAKELHNEDKAPLVFTGHTTPYTALQEINEGHLKLIYREPASAEIAAAEDDTEEEEE